MQTQSNINASTVAALLASTAGATFAQITYTTVVATAAAHKHKQVLKHTVANVQLFNNLRAYTNAYALAVKRSAQVEDFVVSSNYFAHNNNCYSIVEHKQNAKQYLFCIYNNAQSTYTIDGVAATKQQVAALLTASASAKLLNPSSTTYNKTNNIEHSVVVRTIALANILQITANKQTLVA